MKMDITENLEVQDAVGCGLATAIFILLTICIILAIIFFKTV